MRWFERLGAHFHAHSPGGEAAASSASEEPGPLLTDLPRDVVAAIGDHLRGDIDALFSLSDSCATMRATLREEPKTWSRAAANALPTLPRGSLGTLAEVRVLVGHARAAQHNIESPGLRPGGLVPRRLQPGAGPLAWSPRGEWTAEGTTLYAMPGWRPQALPLPPDPRALASFSPDGKTLVLRRSDAEARVVDLVDRQRRPSIEVLAATVWSHDSSSMIGLASEAFVRYRRHANGCLVETGRCAAPGLAAAPLPRHGERVYIERSATGAVVAGMGRTLAWAAADAEQAHVFVSPWALDGLRSLRWASADAAVSIWRGSENVAVRVHRLDGDELVSQDACTERLFGPFAWRAGNAALALSGTSRLTWISPLTDPVTLASISLPTWILDLDYASARYPDRLALTHGSPEGLTVRVFVGHRPRDSILVYTATCGLVRWLDDHTLAVLALDERPSPHKASLETYRWSGTNLVRLHRLPLPATRSWGLCRMALSPSRTQLHVVTNPEEPLLFDLAHAT